MEQVTTGSADRPDIIATTALESTPPERNAPKGTSDIMRSFTDSRRRSINSSPASCSVGDAPVLNGTSQYSTGAGAGLPRFKHRVHPGESFHTPLKMVRGSGT